MTFKYCVNPKVKDKSDDFLSLTTEFEDTEGTIRDVINHISSGHSVCASLFNGLNRSKASVYGSQWLLLDIDNSGIAKDDDGNPLDENNRPLTIKGRPVDVEGNFIDKSDGRKAKKIYKKELTIEEALEHPFVRNHCALIYTTASHSTHWHRFRLIFILDKFIQDRDLIEAMIDLLMEQLPHDPSCKDASRIFYGNTAAEFPLINDAARLPAGWDLLAASKAQQQKERRAELEKKAQQRREEFQRLAKSEEWNTDQLINDALFSIPSRQPGSQNYGECLKVLMALHSHYGTEAEALAEIWSPSIPGNSWNIGRKIRSFRRDGTTIATLFAIAKNYGFKFPQVKKAKNRAIADRVSTPVMDKYTEAKESREKDTFEDLIEAIREAKTTLTKLAKRNFAYEKIIKRFQISKRVFDQALAEVESALNPNQKRSYSWKDFLKVHEEEAEWVLPGILPRGDLTLFAGPPKSGKSLHSYEAAYQLMTGGIFCGGFAKKGKVLFIQADEGQSSTIDRIVGRNISELEDQFRIMPKFSFSRMEDLEQELIDFGPDLIIVDTLRDALRATGIDENTAEAGHPLGDFKDLLKKYKAGAILIHYTKKGEAKGSARVSGSNALVAKMASVYEFSKPGDSSEFKMEALADRNGPLSNYYHGFIQNHEGWSLKMTGEEGSDEGEAGYSDSIIKVMMENYSRTGKKEFYAPEVAELLGVTPDRAKGVYMALKRLAGKEAILRTPVESRGRRKMFVYSLPERRLTRGGGEAVTTSLNPLPNKGSGDSNSILGNRQKEAELPLNERCNAVKNHLQDLGSNTLASITEKQGVTAPCYQPEVLGGMPSITSVTKTTPLSLSIQEPLKDAHPKGKSGILNKQIEKMVIDTNGLPYFVGSTVSWNSVLPSYQKMRSFQIERLMTDGVKLAMVREIIPHDQIEAIEDISFGLRTGHQVTIDYDALRKDGLPVKEMNTAQWKEIPDEGSVCTVETIEFSADEKAAIIEFSDSMGRYCQEAKYLRKV